MATPRESSKTGRAWRIDSVVGHARQFADFDLQKKHCRRFPVIQPNEKGQSRRARRGGEFIVADGQRSTRDECVHRQSRVSH